MALSPDQRRVALLLLATALAYANGFAGSFQYDDFNVIVGNPAVHSVDAWWQAGPGIRPWLKLSYALNWSSGTGLAGFHAVNLLLHGANAWLLWAVLRRFSGGAHSDAAWLAALLFALHPMQTEAVTYISGRSTSLMTTCYLAALLAWLQGHRGWAPLFYLAALGVKEVALTLPLLLWLWQWCEGERPLRALRRLGSIGWLTALALVAMLASARYRELLEFSLALRSAPEQAGMALQTLLYLTSRLFMLGGQNIDPHLAPPGPASLWLGAGLLVTALVMLPTTRSRMPALSLGLGWFLLHLLPAASLIPRLDPVNDRHFYLAGAGLMFPLAQGLLRATSGCSAMTRALGLMGILLLLAGFTVMRNHDYRSETALWQDTVQKSPDNARAWNNLGYALWQENRISAAEAAFSEALRLRPHHARAAANLRDLRRHLRPEESSR